MTPIHEMLRDAYHVYWGTISNSNIELVEKLRAWADANPGADVVDQTVVDEALAVVIAVRADSDAKLKARLTEILERLT